MNNRLSPEWDRIITPDRGWFEIDIKDLIDYSYLILLFVHRDLASRYKQTILGPVWFLLQPLITTVIFTIVFGKIAGLSTDGLPQVLFYMTGIVAWSYFSESMVGTSKTFTQNAPIFGKVYFPRLVMPIATVLSSMILFGIQLTLLLGFVGYYYVQGSSATPNAHVLLLPALLLVMASLGLGLGIIVSSLTTKYRDLTNLVGFGVQLLMYGTPVIYPVVDVPERYKMWVLANPMSPVIEMFRYSMIGGTFPGYMPLLYSICATIIILTIGVILFNRVERTFMDTV